MALVQRRRFQVPAAVAAAMANPQIREQVLALARQAGNGIANAARNVYNNIGNDVDNSYDFNEEEDRMEPDSTNDTQIGPPPLQMTNTTSSQGANGGLGRYKGNTSTKSGWERYFFEQDIFHSRKIQTRDLLWGFSRWTKYDINNRGITLNKYGDSYGLVYRPEITGTDPTQANMFHIFNTAGETYVSISDMCYSQSINFKVGDFFDKKILSEKGGALRNFVKIQLIKFGVKIQFMTRRKSAFDWNNQMFHLIERFSGAAPGYSSVTNYHDSHFALDAAKYWVYRDKNGDYIDANSLDIPTVPPDAKAGVEDKLPRTCHQIRAFDNNLCVCSDHEPFSFEREINSQGAYYLVPQQIYEMRKSNIASLVNLIEHQYGTSNILKNLPEYYNLLIVPCNVDWFETHMMRVGGTSSNPVNGHLVLSDYSTTLAITYTATWKGFNYNHKGELQATTLTTSVVDPYYLAEHDYNASLSALNNQMDKNLV